MGEQPKVFLTYHPDDGSEKNPGAFWYAGCEQVSIRGTGPTPIDAVTALAENLLAELVKA